MSEPLETPSSLLTAATTEEAAPGVPPGVPPVVEAEAELPPLQPENAPEAPPVVPPVAAVTLEELVLPEGLLLKQGDEVLPEAQTFLDFVNAKGLGKEGADALLSLHSEFLQRASEEYLGRWETTQADWQRQVRELPEIGGDALPGTLRDIAKVLDRYGNAELREALAVTGAGNHPAMVKFMANLAKDLNEAAPVRGSNPASTKSLEQRMYPSS